MEVKKRLGEELVKLYHNEDEAKKAREWFENVFSKKNMNVDLPEAEVPYVETGIIDLIVKELKLLATTSDARRLIQQGGLKIDDKAVSEIEYKVTPVSGMIIRAGKKKIVKIK